MDWRNDCQGPIIKTSTHTHTIFFSFETHKRPCVSVSLRVRVCMRVRGLCR